MTQALLLTLIAVSRVSSSRAEAKAPAPEVDPAVVGWLGDPDPKVALQPCSFVPGGNLVTVMGSSSGGNTSSGEDLFVLRHGDEQVLSVAQEGNQGRGGGILLEKHWKITCAPGMVYVNGVPLRYGRGGFSLDSAWNSDPSDDADQEETLANLRAHQVPGAEEADSRVQLALAKSAMAEGDRQTAQSWVSRIGSLPPALAAEAAELQKVLEAAARTLPIRVGTARRVGTLERFPGSTTDDGTSVPFLGQGAPALFWRGSTLCVRQDTQGAEPASTMRCYDPGLKQWGRSEVYCSPFVHNSPLTFQYLARPGDYRTSVTELVADGGVVELGDILQPQVLAREIRGRTLAIDNSPGDYQGYVVDLPADFDLRDGAGSGLIDRGAYFFLEDGRLHAPGKGAEWVFIAPGLPREGCSLELVSPDGKWLSCVCVATPARVAGRAPLAGPKPSLWVVPLGPSEVRPSASPPSPDSLPNSTGAASTHPQLR